MSNEIKPVQPVTPVDPHPGKIPEPKPLEPSPKDEDFNKELEKAKKKILESFLVLTKRWDARLSIIMKEFESIRSTDPGKDVARGRIGELAKCATELEAIVKEVL